MRAACRNYLNLVPADTRQNLHHFQPFLRELRGCFAKHIAPLAVQYGVDIEGELAKLVLDSGFHLHTSFLEDDRFKGIRESEDAEQDGPANGSQPFRSE